MQIVSERERKTITSYELYFEDNPHCGFGFPCDEKGNVLIDKMTEGAICNYEACKAGKFPHLIHTGFRENTHSYMEPAVGICDVCGRKVELYNEYCGATECECGQWYNLSGQRLNPPNQWEEPIDYDY